jgi:DNA-directed RNA polymerase specialized sigma24 family protein
VAERDTSVLEQLLAQRGDDLMRAAVALTGRRPEAEDLLQAALERLLRNLAKLTPHIPRGFRQTQENVAR